MSLRSIDPATGELMQDYPEMSLSEVAATLSAAGNIFANWRHTPVAERAGLLRNAAEVLLRDKETHAKLMAREMGKPLVQGLAEVEKCALNCRYYADHTEGFLANEEVATEASHSFVTFQPLGAILAVMPWNFPYWQVFRFAAPALAAGNTVVLKHASNVSGCALAIERVFHDAGFPRDVFRTLLVGSHAVASIIAHPAVAAVTLTGSTPAGQAVAAEAGRHIKKTVLELGGSDAYVVLADADLDLTVETCVASRLINSGQSCIAAKRFIVVEPLRKAFEECMVALMQKKKVAPPLETDVDVGPQARSDLRDALHRQVEQSLRQGARLLLGGHVPARSGAFYPPTVLTDVHKGMTAFEEELFGPVAAIIPAKDEEEAIRLANDSVFGLGAAIFTRDVRRGEQIAVEKIEAGSVFVNAFVRSDPRLPFGGIKQSGYGRELSHFGLREFVNIKTVYVK